MVTDVSGNIVKQIDYDSFGNIISDTDASFEAPFGFAGGLHDRDTGLVRFGARDYDPDVGRWTAKDPILFQGGDSILYSYVSNNPINFTDPNGLFLPQLAGGLVGGLVGAYKESEAGGDTTDILTAAAVGTVAGVVSTIPIFGPGLMSTIVMGAATGAVNEIGTEYLLNCHNLSSLGDIAYAGGTGAVANVFGARIGETVGLGADGVVSVFGETVGNTFSGLSDLAISSMVTPATSSLADFATRHWPNEW